MREWKTRRWIVWMVSEIREGGQISSLISGQSEVITVITSKRIAGGFGSLTTATLHAFQVSVTMVISYRS